jgi:phage shock protein A
MSRSKTSAYTLAAAAQNAAIAAEKERRALIQVRAVWDEVCRSCEMLAQSIAEARALYGETITVATPSIPKVTDQSVKLRAAARDLESSIAAAMEALQTLVANARAASIIQPTWRATAAADKSSSFESLTVKEEVEAVLRSLDADLDVETRTKLERFARSILDDVDSARANRSVIVLQHETAAANGTTASIRQRRVDIIALRTRLLGLETCSTP